MGGLPKSNAPNTTRRIEAGPSTFPFSTNSKPTRPKSPPTSAQAYANAHTPIRNLHTRESSAAGASTGGGAALKLGPSKPIFEWITKKLTNRRATIGDIAGRSSRPISPNKLDSTDRHGPVLGHGGQSHGHGYGHNRAGTREIAGPSRIRYPSLPRNSVAPLQLSKTRETDNSGSEAFSFHNLSTAPSNLSEHERRRERNNPYALVPLPPIHRESTIESASVWTSRTPSIRSERSRASSIPRRHSLDGGGSWKLAGRADEDASVRPIPPSHPGSPTLSHSFISRSASASLLSPRPEGSTARPRPETYYSTGSGIGGLSMTYTEGSFDTDDGPGRQSRQDSTSTKPTTIMSFDGPLPTTHIAQVATGSHPSSPLRSSLSYVQDPVLDASALASASASEVDPTPATTPTSPSPVSVPVPLMQAPKHSQPHPRDNPRPASPPDPNASTLTLASSTFAAPPLGSSFSPSIAPSVYTNHRPSSLHQIHLSSPQIFNGPFGASPLATPLTAPPANRAPSLATSPSITWARETDRNSMINYPASLHPTVGTSWKGGAGWNKASDGDASVRAVRRKGSWESNESGWSWRAGLATPLAGYTPGTGAAGGSGAPQLAVPTDKDKPDHTPRITTSVLAPPLGFDDTPMAEQTMQIPSMDPLGVVTK